MDKNEQKPLTIKDIEFVQKVMYETNTTGLYYTNEEGEETPRNIVDDLDVFELVADRVDTEILLKDMKEILKPREYTILLLRFGFDGQVRTLDEIGKMYKLTRERIRQIEARALNKLKKRLKNENKY